MNKFIIRGVIVVIVLIGVILVGIHLFKASSSQSNDSSVSDDIPAKASARPYSRADSPSNSSNDSPQGVQGHLEKGLEHFGL